MGLNRNGQYVLQMVLCEWCGGCQGLRGAGKENGWTERGTFVQNVLSECPSSKEDGKSLVKPGTKKGT
jgi:hypothetical protein